MVVSTLTCALSAVDADTYGRLNALLVAIAGVRRCGEFLIKPCEHDKRLEDSLAACRIVVGAKFDISTKPAANPRRCFRRKME